MTLRAISALAALSGALVLAGWGALGTAGTTSGETIETVTPAQRQAATMPAAERANKGPRAATPVAPAAVVDSSLLIPTAFAPPQYMLASVPREPEPVSQAIPPAKPELLVNTEIVARADPQATGTVRPAPISPEARKAAEEWKKDGHMLTVAQIPRIKAALRLSTDQEAHWRAVEGELREIARQIEAQHASGKPVKLSADTAQRLYWTAGPLIMSLREDQKHEARRLAKLMGLDQVASLL
jgi:hypothetical protein